MLLLDINNTTISVVILLFVVVVFIVYFLLIKVLIYIGAEKPRITIFKKILVVLLSMALAYLIVGIKYWVSGKGLLE